MSKYILSIDQGTSSCRAILFDIAGTTISIAQKEFTQLYPKPGWVEHDPLEILQTQIECIKKCIKDSSIDPSQITCAGITNQRETTVVWNRYTGAPVCNAIVWQCRRTQSLANELKQETKFFQEKTGLIPDAYFSGPKISWILDNIPEARAQAESGNLIFGTIDSWLIWNLTCEKNHFTEPSNASRTMLFNINSLSWDSQLLSKLEIPKAMMPKVVQSGSVFGTTRKDLLGFEIPITAVLGDQQAALFGQACFEKGMAKCTYGTGSFLLANIGNKFKLAPGLLTTVGWNISPQNTIYAYEGSSFVSGAIMQWLKDGLGIIKNNTEIEPLANSLGSNEGVYMIPALVGLGSPWWNSNVKGAIFGITHGTTRAHLVRAAVESMAYQVTDIVESMIASEVPLKELQVDGGATRNNFLLQFQSDLLGIPVLRSAQQESTAWGVAALAGLTSGIIKELREISAARKYDRTFTPIKKREQDYAGWRLSLKALLEVK